MAIAHESTTTGSNGASVTSIAITLPAAATTGRLMLVSLKIAGVATQTWTPPAGWTVATERASAHISVGHIVTFYKVAAAGDASASRTFAWSTAGSVAWSCTVYSGTDTTTPITSPATPNGATMNTTTLTVNAVTMTAANSVMYACYGATPSGVSYTTGTMTERSDNLTFSFGSADEAIAASGSTGTRSITASGTVNPWTTLAFGINEAVAATVTLTQTTFRGRNDDGNETTATWKATAGTDWTQAVDTNFRVRFNINATIAAPTQNTAFILRYSLNGGAYTAVSASSSVVRAFASANLADGAATTEQLAGAGTFNAGTFDEVDGSATGFTAATASGQDTEVEYSVQIRSVDVVNGDTINLRIYNNAGAVLNGGYTDTPVITVSEAVVHTQVTFRGRNDDGSETTATWKAAAGVDWTQPLDTNFRVRFLVSSANSPPIFQTGFGVFYSINGGAYSAGYADASSSFVRTSLSPNITDGASTTEQLGGSGTFNPGELDETDGWASGFVGGTETLGDDTEVEICLQLRSADGLVPGNTVALRLGYTVGGGLLNGGYTDIPVITVSAPAASFIWPTETPYRILSRR